MSHRLMRLSAAFIVATLTLTGLLGCGSDKSTNPPPGAGSTTFTGVVVGNGANGTLTITVATSTPKVGALVTATGTFTPTGGAAIALAGNHDTDADAVLVTGGTWEFGAQYVNGRLEGGAIESGTLKGYFTLVEGSTAEVTVIVGRFDSDDIAEPDGDFSLSISGAQVYGNAVADGKGDVTPLNGTYTAATDDISIVNPLNPTGPPLATGTYNATTGAASGTFDDGKGSTGSWSGTRQ